MADKAEYRLPRWAPRVRKTEIEGSVKSTMAFLERLTYGDSVPEDVLRTREQWRRTWAKNEWSHGRGQ